MGGWPPTNCILRYLPVLLVRRRAWPWLVLAAVALAVRLLYVLAVAVTTTAASAAETSGRLD